MNNQKKHFLLIVVVSVCIVLSGCASMTNSLKSINANTDWVRPNITADLDVSPNKTVGVADGRKNQITGLKKIAMLDALTKYNSGRFDKDIADLLVEPTYFYEYDGFGNVKVTVIGYPARYKNFRSPEKPQSFLQDATNNTSLLLNTTRQNEFTQNTPKTRNSKIVGGQWLMWSGLSLLGVGIPLTAAISPGFTPMVAIGGASFISGTSLYTVGVIERRRENSLAVLIPEKLEMSPNKIQFTWAF